MLSKLKSEFKQVSKTASFKISTIATTCAIAISQSAFASDSAPTLDNVVDSMTSTFATVSSTCLSAVAAVAPVGVTIFGFMFVWKKGIQFFKRLTQG